MEIRKLFKYGGYSLCITIPKKILKELGFKENDIFIIDKKENMITIRKYHSENKNKEI